MLPHIFLRAMRGVSTQVDSFLGMAEQPRSEIIYSNILTKIANPVTPTVIRKSTKGSGRKGPQSTASLQSKVSSSSVSQKYSTSPNAVTSGPSGVASSIDMQPRPAPDRPQVNSVLHLYGQWLFDAALTGVKGDTSAASRERGGSITARSRSSSGVYPTSMSVGPMASSTTSTSTLPQDGISLLEATGHTESYDAGRSEACGTLCRIFSCKKTGEQILPVYLSRFYLTLAHGLFGESNQVLASILINSVNLFRIDLPGVTCLLPAVLSALETILPDRDLLHFKQYVNITELRRASIHLLLSLIPLPLHFNDLPIEDIQSLWLKERSSDADDSSSTTSPTRPGCHTFRGLKLRIIHQLIGALQCETDPINAQMILGGMLLALQDSALVEAVSREDDAQSGYLGGVQRNGNETADTAYGLFVQCIYLVSQRLESWKSELSVSLAALELLSGLAKAKIHITDSGECRRAVQELCRYIVSQCERPPPHHKRELHSMIVAAFHTLTTWLLEHPYLLNDKDCLNEVLEIIELGISGTKSRPGRRESNGLLSGLGQGGLLVDGSTGDRPVLKGEKDLNPASMRVLEAAEGALVCVFEHLGSSQSPCYPTSLCSLLNEQSLVGHAPDHTPDTPLSAGQSEFTEAVRQFRYFVVHNSVLLGIMEQNLGNEEEPCPTVTTLIRSASGRKARVMQFRQTARSEAQSSRAYLVSPPRPSPAENPGVHYNVRHRTFPEEVDRIPLVKADCSIPLLSEIPNEQQAERLNKLKLLIEQQKQYDARVERRIHQSLSSDDDSSFRMSECIQPIPEQEFQSARLLLSHLNLLTLSSVKQHAHQRLGPDLVMLNRNDPDFPSDLEDLDSIPVRSNDTVFIFYHKAGQKTKEQILENTSMNCGDLRPEFSEFILSLGWPVDLEVHPGWTGHTTTSWKLNKSKGTTEDPIDLNLQYPGIFSSDRYILYNADVSTETAFIIPTRKRPLTPLISPDSIGEGDNDGLQKRGPGVRPKFQLDLSSTHSSSGISSESPSSPTGSLGGARTKKISPSNRTNVQQLPDCRVAIVWTESYDGIDEFPLGDIQAEMHTGQETTAMARSSSKDVLAIFIHPLENGLFRISVNGQSSVKSGMAIPLVSGAVVSRRTLGAAVRMTATNMCHRRRLDSDAYCPPHIKRKHRINELLARYQRRCTEPDFFTAVFTEQHIPKSTLADRMLKNQQRSTAGRPLSVA